MSFSSTLFESQIEDLSDVRSEMRGDLLFDLAPFGRRAQNKTLSPSRLDLARKLGYRTVLNWDALMTHEELLFAISELEKLDLSKIDRIRVADEGALFYLLKNSHCDLEISIENGSHNLRSILAWYELSPTKIKRLILSLQIPKERLLQYLPKIKCEVEILVLGPISIFYSPRKLLSPLFGKKSEIIATGTSEESPHKGFLITESYAGTSMYHIKDINLLDYLSEFSNFRSFAVRFDFFGKRSEALSYFYQFDPEKLKASWPIETTKGLFLVNKSDVLFKKLKNKHLSKTNNDILAEVISVDKDEGTILRVNKELLVKEHYMLITPDGKRRVVKIEKILHLTSGEELSSASMINVIVPALKGATAKSIIVKNLES